MMDLKSLEFHKEVDEILKKKNVYIVYDDPIKEVKEKPEEMQEIIDWYQKFKK